MEARDLINTFRAVSDETRLRMLKLLLKRELCVCEIMQAMDISQSRASRNLGILEDAGILRSWRSGAWVHYAVDEVWAGSSGRPLVELVMKSRDSDATQQDAARLAKAVRLDSRACSPPCAPGGARA